MNKRYVDQIFVQNSQELLGQQFAVEETDLERRNGRSKSIPEYLERCHVLSMIERSGRRNEQNGGFVDRVSVGSPVINRWVKKFAEMNDVGKCRP